MRRFILQCLVFGTAIVATCFVIEWRLLYIENEYTYKRNYMDSHLDSIKTLILGNSHLVHGLVPDELGDSCFMLAMRGRHQHYDAELAERYVPKMKKLKIVIISLSYQDSFYSYINNRHPEPFNNSYRCLYDKYMDISYGAPLRFYWSEFLFCNEDFIGRFKKPYRDRDIFTTLGWISSDYTNKSTNWQQKKLPGACNWDDEVIKKAVKENASYMSRIAKVCHDNGVKLILVATPVWKTYQNMMTIQGEKQMNALANTAKKVCPNTEIYNYQRDKRFINPDYYIDSSHLSSIGAHKLTHILKKESGI